MMYVLSELLAQRPVLDRRPSTKRFGLSSKYELDLDGLNRAKKTNFPPKL
jgi:hypothetical protein